MSAGARPAGPVLERFAILPDGGAWPIGANATVEGLLRMTERKDPPEDGGPARADDVVTPGDEPSALERGARIFERLRQRRKPNRDRAGSGAD